MVECEIIIIYQHFTGMFKEVEFFSKKTSFNEGQRATSWAENLTSVASMMWKEGWEEGDLLFDHSGGDVSIYTI